jgi:hypothetical protein
MFTSRAGSRAAINGPNQMIRLKEKGHLSMPFFRLSAGRNKLTTCSKRQAGRLGPPEGYERQAEQAGTEEKQR